MGRGRKPRREALYGPQRDLTLRSRLFVLLRDELGLGRQPKVARLLVEEIVGVVESTLVTIDHLRPGQLLVLAPEVGQGPSLSERTLAEKKLRPVRLTLVADEDIARRVAGETSREVRKQRLVRIVCEAYQQGATLSAAHLAIITGVSADLVHLLLAEHTAATGQTLPLRGVVEDIGAAVSHKAEIVARHLKGETTSEISRATNHTPRSVERYLQRFEQVRELASLLQDPRPEVMARILGCSARIVAAYLDLIAAGATASSEGASQEGEEVG